MRANILHWIGKRKLRRYLYEKDMIAWNIFPQIDFEPLRIYLSSQSKAFNLWFTKHWTGFCGIGAKMHQMKLWDNDLCPCCRQIPERKTMHIFICPHPNMIKVKEQLFSNILLWLEEVHTDPLLITIITKFWHGEELTLEDDCSPMILNIYKTLRDIGVHQMWQGLLPNHIIDTQDQYYKFIGSRKSARKWGIDFVGKMLRASHGIWMERNHILHLRTASGINGLEMIALTTAVTAQYDLGDADLDEEDLYLLDKAKDTILKEPIECIRGWLCEILIARGDFPSARLESLRDRGEISHLIPTLSNIEKELI